MTIGRDPQATIPLDLPWLSRTHVRLHTEDGHWVAVDNSRNGMFYSGDRVASVVIADGTSIRLGDPKTGLEITFSLGESAQPLNTDLATAVTGADEEAESLTQPTDPDVARAGAAVAARRRELDIPQRSLAREKVISGGALIAFEKGRAWPRASTRAKLEELLRWPPGTIDAIRQGVSAPENDATRVIRNTGSSGLIAQSITLALKGIDASITALPSPRSPTFIVRADAVLADLRELRAVAEEAAATTPTPAAALAMALAGVRRRIEELMTMTADAPGASPGRKLYGARRRAGLTAEDVAITTRLPVSIVEAAEAGSAIPPAAQEAIASLLTQLP